MKYFLIVLSLLLSSCFSNQNVINKKNFSFFSDDASSNAPYAYQDKMGIWRTFDNKERIKVLYNNNIYSLNDFNQKYKFDTFKNVIIIKEKKDIIALTNDETCEVIIKVLY
jgi:lipoprotein